MSPLLFAEKFLGPEYVDLSDDAAFEDMSLDNAEFLNVELERDQFINLRNVTKNARMLTYLIKPGTEVVYTDFKRPRWEIRVGYKTARSRGARLEETEVFNLLFQLKGRVKADGIAMMCHGPNNEEWIFLCPDDTEKRINTEGAGYESAASTLVGTGRMDKQFQSFLKENLNRVVPGIRCANSLQHEYGHILQHRIWMDLGIQPIDMLALFDWFSEIGYVENISQRISHFLDRTEDDMVYHLKECFVEDYRIGLNLIANKGIFELPNAYSFVADFQQPDLMYEGVDIVSTAIKNHNAHKKQGGMTNVSYEPDRVSLIQKALSGGLDFDPRNVSRMTPADHQAIRDRIKANRTLHLV